MIKYNVCAGPNVTIAPHYFGFVCPVMKSPVGPVGATLAKGIANYRNFQRFFPLYIVAGENPFLLYFWSDKNNKITLNFENLER